MEVVVSDETKQDPVRTIREVLDRVKYFSPHAADVRAAEAAHTALSELEARLDTTRQRALIGEDGVRRLKERAEKAEAESAGRLQALLAKADEANREWRRAENAEAEREALRAEVERLKADRAQVEAMSEALQRRSAAEVEQLRAVGGLMSNVCFNLAQSPRLEESECERLDRLRKQWDAIPRGLK